MRVKKFAAAVALTVSATGLVQATAQAAPGTVPTDDTQTSPAHAEGTEHGVGYRVTREGNKVVAEVVNGSFLFTGNTVEIRDAAGAVMSVLPLALNLDTHMVRLAPTIDRSGTRMVADVSAQPIDEKITPRDQAAQTGAVVGGIVGAIVGVVLTIFTAGLGIVALPFVVLGGVAIGAAVGAGSAGDAQADAPVPPPPAQ